MIKLSSSSQRMLGSIPRAGEYAIALLAVAVAVWIRAALDQSLGGELPFVTLFGAVGLAVYIGGVWPALLITLVGYVMANTLWIDPRGQLDLSSQHLPGLGAYLFSCGIIITMGTALRRATRKWATAHDRLETVLTATQEGFFMLDRSLRIQYLNPAAESYFGQVTRAMLGQSIWELTLQARGTIFETEFTRALREDTPVHFEAISTFSKRWVEVRAIPTPTGLSIFFHDIEDRKTASENLQSTETRLRFALDAAQMVAWEWNLKTGEVQHLGDSNAILGFDAATLVPTATGGLNLVHEDDRPGLDRAIQKAIDECGEYTQEFRFRSPKGGDYVWKQAWGKVICDPKGKPDRITGTIMDISERKKAQEVQARLATIVEGSEDAIISKSLDGIIRTWNAGAVRLFGYTAEEAIGQSILMLIPQDRQHEETEILSRLRQGKRIEHFDTVRMAKDGRRIEISLSVSPVRDASGKIIGAAKIARDISEHKRIQELQARLATIVESSDDAIVSKSLDGTIRTWNRGAEQLFGYKADEIIGKPVLTLIPPENHDEETQILERIRRGERIEHFETIRVTKDGRRVEVALSVSPMRDSSGKIIGAAKIARDITIRKRIERELESRASERQQLLESEQQARLAAERATRLMDEFLATVSHELRTPLNSILGWSQVLQRSDRDGETLGQGLEAIERSARIQTRLVEDLLDVSRIIAGKVRLDVQVVDLAAVIEAAKQTIQPAADAKTISVMTMVDTQAGPVKGDAARLQQVIWNLLSNAVKFTPRGGKVQIDLLRVNSHVEINVSDTGEGIKPEFLPHVFERFRQADSSSTRRHGGLGLGLAIVRHIVELHGGTVSVTSDGEGKGSTFSVHLPISVTRWGSESREFPGAAGFGAPMMGHEIRLSGVQVLVVDDDPDACEVLRRILIERQADVKVATSAREALASIDSSPPDVLVSDIGMPGMDGYDFIREVRRRKEPMGAVAVTAFARSEDRIRALQAGYNMHISKPVEPVELISMVANLAKKPD